MKIAVLVPVYQSPKRAGDIIRKVLADRYPDKQMVLVVDGGTNEEIESQLSPFKDQAVIYYQEERLGKVASLNAVAARLDCDVFLFLDNDVLLPDDPEYLTRLALEMENHDLTEIPKEAIVSTFMSRMMRYEFLSYAMTGFVFAKVAKRNPTMNGAAFAVRKSLFEKLNGFRSVVHEDMDFAARAFHEHARYSYNPALKVGNEVPTDVKRWLHQRKRWAMNYFLWLKENLLKLVKPFFRNPSFLLGILLLLLPMISYVAVLFVFKYTHGTPALPFIFMIAQHFNVLTGGLFLWVSHFFLIFTEGILPSLGAILFSGVVYFLFARLLGFRFNPLEFLVYYVIYSPIWLLVNLVMGILVLLKVDIKLDWKV